LYFERAVKRLELSPAVQVSSFDLKNLAETDVLAMLSETLMIDHDQLRSLETLVYSLSKGNPTFVRELLRDMQDEGILSFDETTNQWTCDFHKVPLKLDGIESVLDLSKAKVKELPENVQETLKIAACLGSCVIDESLLQMIDPIGSASSHLKHAAVKGIFTWEGGTYNFASDSIHQATYDLIPMDDRGAYHLKIGQKLWKFLDDRDDDEFMFIVLRQLMMAGHLLAEASDLRSVAMLCLKAGQHAVQTSSFQASRVYLSHGILLLSTQKMWGRDNYDLSLALHNALIEVCYCTADFSRLDRLVGEVLLASRSFEDSLLARRSQIYALGSRNRQPEAIDIALHALKGLGEWLPAPQKRIATHLSLARAFRRVNKALLGLSDEDILDLPPMRDTQALAKMQVLNHIILYTFYAAPALSCLVIIRMVELTVKYGLSTISSVGFSFFALLRL
jgi:predicted ATPase